VPLGQLGPLILQTASTGYYAAVPGALIVPRMTFSLSLSHTFSLSLSFLSLFSLCPFLFFVLFLILSLSLAPSLSSLCLFLSFFLYIFLSFSFFLPFFLSLSGFAQKKVWTEARPFRTFSMRKKKRIRNEIQSKKRDRSQKERERGSKNTVLGGGMLERRTI
jgi:hypothetical protein